MLESLTTTPAPDYPKLQLRTLIIMPRAKKETKGTLTGSELSSKTRGRKKKAETTESKHFDKPKSILENAGDIAGKVSNAVNTAANTVGAVRDGVQSIQNGARQLRRSVTGGSDLVTGDTNHALTKADDLAANYGLKTEIDLHSALSGDPYAVDDSIPEMTAKEANALKLRIQRQNNALEVRHERTKQKRKIVAIGTEETRLKGDLVDYATAGIETATKVVKNQIADTKFQTEQSKLEETEELLEQQDIRTQGTIRLTEGVRDEWDLRFEKQQRNNEK
ncbi:MAG: hypothetical protein AAFR37_23050, partial [Cyanobacteria bacterium J06628_3]